MQSLESKTMESFKKKKKKRKKIVDVVR